MTGSQAEESGPFILALDHNRANLALLTRFLAGEGYRALTAATLEEGNRVLEEYPGTAAALLCVEGFDAGVWTLCENLHGRGIPFLVICQPQRQVALTRESLRHGGGGVLIKPLAARELLSAIKSLLGE